MLHHISFPVSNLGASRAMYSAALGALGYRIVYEDNTFVGYGIEDNQDKFALKLAAPVTPASSGFHLAFSASSREAVDLFHQYALANGGTDNGEPGLRPNYGATYYAAFIIDLDGHRIEAVHS